MDKGITLEQAVRVCRALTRSGISVHAYLMYGFPTETEQEMIDSLERVRQLYQSGYIQSANWQRFVLTIHSPMARNPDRYGTASGRASLMGDSLATVSTMTTPMRAATSGCSR